MNLPKIDLSSIPGLETPTGVFGSMAQSAANFDDSVVAIMVIVYESTLLPAGLG